MRNYISNTCLCEYWIRLMLLNPLNANPEKWSNTLKQIVGNLPTICLSVFDHFMNLALKGLITHTCQLFRIEMRDKEKFEGIFPCQKCANGFAGLGFIKGLILA